MIEDKEVEDFLEHFGVKGMKWGVRRDKTTGIRPIAKTLNDSRFAKVSQKNVDRHDRSKAMRKENGVIKFGERRHRRLERLSDAGVKGGSKAAKARAILIGRLGVVDLVRGRGITGAAARKSLRMANREPSMKAGTAHVSTKIAYYSGTKTSDFIPVRSRNVGKSTIMDNHALVLVGAGALFVANVAAKRAVARAVQG